MVIQIPGYGIDLFFYRPLGYFWACVFRKMHQTPNVITILSIFLGVGAGILFYFDDYLLNIIGIILLVWANSFDSADGQLARMTKQYSRIGRILDGVAGDLWFLSIYICLVLRLIRHNEIFSHYPACIWILALLAGVSHIVQSSIADRFRQFHLFILDNGRNKELESTANIRRLIADPAQKPIAKFFYRVYLIYTRIQEKVSPSTQAVIDLVKEDNMILAENHELQQKIRKLSFPQCKWENFLTFNWRSIVLFISILINIPWLYFAIELTVFNAILVLLIVNQNRACKKIVRFLKKEPPSPGAPIS